MKSIVAAALLLAVLASSALAATGTPTQTVKTAVDQILVLLRDPTYKGSGKKSSQGEKIIAIVEGVFDFRAFSVRTLGKNWKEFSPAQQDEFVKLYTELLEDTYLERVQQYSDEDVVFTEEVKLDDTKSEVRTNIIAKTGPIPLFYRLYSKDGAWKVYDVLVENVSLVNNYRSQFDDILKNGKAEDLLKRLRDKTAS